MINHAVIMAGGKGTRLSALTKGEIPKPMAPVLGKPLLLWQLEELKRNGIGRVTMVVGHLKEKITGYFGDGRDFGLEIDYVEEETPLGTAGAFALLKEHVPEDRFLLVFGDLLFSLDLARMEEAFLRDGAEALLFVHPNSHPYDSDLVRTAADGRVTAFDSKKNVRTSWYDNCVNAGLYMLDRRMLDRVPEPVKTDFEKDLLAPMAERGEAIYAYRSPEYVKDVGTMDRIAAAEQELSRGLPEKRNLKNTQKAVFLDRDGVINVEKGFISRAEQFELLPGAAEAIRRINASGYLAVVATNQPVIARGEATLEQLDEIFRKMKTLLGQEGAYVDDVFFCPHHPDRGFPGERPEYKIRCDCRKPETGMLKAAAERYHIDLSESIVVGDMTQDIEFGRRGGCRTVLVLTGNGGKDGKYDVKPDYVCRDLLDAVETLGF